MEAWTLFCEGNPTIMGIFDPTYAPELLYYVYVPVIVAALALAVVVYAGNAQRLVKIYFVGLTLALVAYLLNEIVQWAAVPVAVNMLGWQLIDLYRILILIGLLGFVHTFLLDREPGFIAHLLVFICVFPVLALMPTPLNIELFDVWYCEGWPTLLSTYYLVGLEVLTIIALLYIGLRSYLRSRSGTAHVLSTLVTIGAVLFVAVLSSLDLYSELIQEYEINVANPIGALIFLIIITYLTVRYKGVFSSKVFGAQVLVVGLMILVGSLALVVESVVAFRIVGVTFALTAFFGIMLIRSVQREIEARRLLAEANAGQERFIHFLSHEVKGFLTVARNGFASIAEGDFGPVPEQLTAMAKNALSRVNGGVTTVESILKSANLKSGKVTFKFAPFDFCAAIRKRIDMAKPLLEERKLTIDADLPDGDYIVVGDQEHITNHVLKNLIENAIFYTPQGNIHVALTRSGNMLHFSVKDTGVGITAEDKKRLFTEGGQGANAMKVNAHSTGHGLYIAKSIVTAHGGRIWAESEGEGKGTTFIVELPVNPPNAKAK